MTDVTSTAIRGAVLRRWTAALLTGIALSSCAVGPDYTPPPAPPAARFTKEPTASPGRGQSFDARAEVDARWWTAFGLPGLNRLIDEALAHSPTLEAAEAAIRAADATTRAQIGGFFPQISSDSTGSRQATSLLTTSTSAQKPYNLFTKQLQLSFTPDIWGGNYRAVESLEAQAERKRFELAAARLTLIANVITTAVADASLRGQIAVTEKLILAEEEQLTLLRRQHELGAATGLDISSQESTLAQARQTLPALQKQLAFQRDRLTALVGRYPDDEIEQIFTLSKFTQPPSIPLRLPAAVVEKRPDIRAAAADVHSAGAEIGVAIAARLPNVTITANAGASAYQLAQLFTPGTGFYTLAGNIAQPLFEGMTLLNRQEAAEARLDEAKARYRSTVVDAFREVADTLRALQSDAKAAQQAQISEAAALRFYTQARMQKREGAASQLTVVIAEQSYLRAALSRVQADADRLSDAAAFFMAIGG